PTCQMQNGRKVGSGWSLSSGRAKCRPAGWDGGNRRYGRSAVSRVIKATGSPAMCTSLSRLLAPAMSDRSRRASRHSLDSSRSNPSLAWFSTGGAVTAILNLPAAIPSMRSALARGVSRMASRTPSAATLRGDAVEDGGNVLVDQDLQEIEDQD